MESGKESKIYSRLSMIHELDAAVKLLCFLLLLLALFLTDGVVGIAVLYAFVFAVIYLARIPVRKAVVPIRRALPLLMLIFFFSTTMGIQEHIFFRFWFFSFSLDGILLGLWKVLRLVLLLLLAMTIEKTTGSVSLVNGMTTLLRPLGCFGVSALRISDALLLAIRLVPALFEDTDRLRRAQHFRGLKKEKNGYLDRANILEPILVPLFVCAFRRGENLSMALTARGFFLERETLPMRKNQPGKLEWAALCVCAVVPLLQIFVF